MASSSLAIDTLQRLVDQVQALSAVVETLTLRLLELEERLLEQERHLHAAEPQSLGPAAERRLAETEQRLLGLEQLLAPSAPSHSSGAGRDVKNPPGSCVPPSGDSVSGEPDLVDPVAINAALYSAAVGEGGVEDASDALRAGSDDPDAEEGWEIEDDWSDREVLTA
jgi:hypothetical protein